MFDLSIPKLSDLLRPADLANFCAQRVKITEKFDGTKLTFLKTGPGRDDFVLAYKGSVIPRAMFEEYSISCAESRGYWQYRGVFNLLDECILDHIPEGTEVFIEFTQEKATVLSEYKQHGRMFIIGACQSDWHLDRDGMRLTTFPRYQTANDALMDTVASVFYPAAGRPPVLFDGRLDSPPPHGSRLRPPQYSPGVEFGEYMAKLEECLTGFESANGGRPEGAVMEVPAWRKLFKVVRRDQCDPAVRRKKKAKYRCESPEEEKKYWDQVHELAINFARSSASGSETLDRLTPLIYNSVWTIKKPHAPRTKFDLFEDVLLTSRLYHERLLWADKKASLGVFVMAGKPVHAGHWKMIKRAAYENMHLLLIVSTADRGSITGESMFRVWKEVLMDELPDNVTLRFSPSPYVEAVHEIKLLAKITAARLAVYGDPNDVDKSWSPDVIRKRLPDLADNRLWVFPIKRELTTKISGTEMRAFLEDGREEDFKENLPKQLSPAKCQRYWEILAK